MWAKSNSCGGDTVKYTMSKREKSTRNKEEEGRRRWKKKKRVTKKDKVNSSLVKFGQNQNLMGEKGDRGDSV